MGLATNVPETFLTVGGNSFSTSLLDTTTFLDGVASPPSVMTTSYGDVESDFSASLATLVLFDSHSRLATDLSSEVRYVTDTWL